MYSLKLTPPVKADQVPETLNAIKAKIDEYEALKKKAFEEFDPEQALKKIKENESEEEEEKNEEQKTNKKQRGSKQSKKAVGIEDFPEL